MNKESENREMMERKLRQVVFLNLLDALKEDAAINRVVELNSQKKLLIMTVSEEFIESFFPKTVKKFQSQNMKIKAVLGVAPVTYESMQVHAFLMLREDLVPKVGETGNKMEGFRELLNTITTVINGLPGEFIEWRIEKGTSTSKEGEDSRLKALIDVVSRKPSYFMLSESINPQATH